MVWDYEIEEYSEKYKAETEVRREKTKTRLRKWRAANPEQNNKIAKKARKAYFDRWKARDPESYYKWYNNKMKLYMREYKKRKKEQGE